MWRGLGARQPNGNNAEGLARFHILGNDVVVTTMDNRFVTILKDGINNLRVIGGDVVWP